MRSRRIIKWLVAVLLVAVTFVVVLRVYVAPRILYTRGTAYDAATYARMTGPWEEYEVSFERDGVLLKGWLIERPDRPLVVFYGGKGQANAGMLDVLPEKLPYSLLMVDYRGYGQSTGEPSERNIVEDSVAILDKVVTESGRSYDDVILFGRSLGTGVATQVAVRRPVGKLMLVVPYDSVAAVADGMCPPVPLSWLLPDSYRSDAYAESVDADVCIYAAGKDQEVPVEHARKLAEAFRQTRIDRPDSVKYKEYPDAGHRNVMKQPGFWEDFNNEIR